MLQQVEAGKKLRCPHERCGYVWQYKGHSLVFAMCPSCRGLVHITKNAEKEIAVAPTTAVGQFPNGESENHGR